MKDIFIQIREKVVSRMKYIQQTPAGWQVERLILKSPTGDEMEIKLGQPIQREVDRKNTDYIILGSRSGTE